MSYFGPTAIQQIDTAIQQGRGAAASVLGQQYDVYRITSGTNNAIVSGTPVISSFRARIQKAQKMKIENQTFDLLVYEATCDNRQIKEQDVLVESSSYYGGTDCAFVYAQHRPTHGTFWVRAEYNASITRPMPKGGQSTQLPSSGITWETAEYSNLERDTEIPLTLTGGLFKFDPTPGATQASVPVGLQPLNRVRDGSSLGTPTDLYREHFLCYVPLLPGEQLNELDRICLPNSAGAPDRYEVALVYTSEYTGLSGYICIVEKLGD